MKSNIIKFSFITVLATLSFTACKKDKVTTPEPVEQELITTVRLKVTKLDDMSIKTFTYKVENGFGSTTQGTVTIDSIILSANKEYNVEVELLNEKENPAEDVTKEVKEESNEHLFIYQSNPTTGNGSIGFGMGNKDGNGNPLNQTIKFLTAGAGKGAITVTLKHEPTNKAATTPDAAGGETDVEATFPVRLQ